MEIPINHSSVLKAKRYLKSFVAKEMGISDYTSLPTLLLAPALALFPRRRCCLLAPPPLLLAPSPPLAPPPLLPALQARAHAPLPSPCVAVAALLLPRARPRPPPAQCPADGAPPRPGADGDKEDGQDL